MHYTFFSIPSHQNPVLFLHFLYAICSCELQTHLYGNCIVSVVLYVSPLVLPHALPAVRPNSVDQKSIIFALKHYMSHFCVVSVIACVIPRSLSASSETAQTGTRDARERMITISIWSTRCGWRAWGLSYHWRRLKKLQRESRIEPEGSARSTMRARAPPNESEGDRGRAHIYRSSCASPPYHSRIILRLVPRSLHSAPHGPDTLHPLDRRLHSCSLADSYCGTSPGPSFSRRLVTRRTLPNLLIDRSELLTACSDAPDFDICVKAIHSRHVASPPDGMKRDDDTECIYPDEPTLVFASPAECPPRPF